MTREEAIKEFESVLNWAKLNRYPYVSKQRVEASKMAITALEQKQEQKTGHWIEHPHEAGPNWDYPKYECSECHEWFEDDSNFCPYCGAEMENYFEKLYNKK